MNIFSDFLDLLFPRTCEACRKVLLSKENLICTQCLLDLPILDFEKEEEALRRKFIGKIEIKKVVSFLKFTKEGKAQRLLHQLKYQNKPEIGRLLGELFGNELKRWDLVNEIDLLLSVPLHAQKEKQRGYNQADYIGMGLSKSLEIPFRNDLIQRVRYSESQTKKSRFDRFKNVENSFQIVEKKEIEGKRIALIDDVLTTGATLEACGEELLKNGCRELSIMTIASAQH